MLKSLDTLPLISMAAGIKLPVKPSSVLIVPTKLKWDNGITLELDTGCGKSLHSSFKKLEYKRQNSTEMAQDIQDEHFIYYNIS